MRQTNIPSRRAKSSLAGLGGWHLLISREDDPSTTSDFPVTPLHFPRASLFLLRLAGIRGAMSGDFLDISEPKLKTEGETLKISQ